MKVELVLKEFKKSFEVCPCLMFDVCGLFFPKFYKILQGLTPFSEFAKGNSLY
jgi:hypothetical protein